MTKIHINVIIEDWQRDAVKQARLNLSEFVRNALSLYFSSDISLKQKEAEIEKEKVLLRAKEAALHQMKDQTAKAESEELLDQERKMWLTTNPKVFVNHQKGVISTKGWQIVCAGLKVTNRKQAEQIIEKVCSEQVAP